MTQEENNKAVDERNLLYSEQVRLLYQNAPLGLIATIINSCVVAFILRKVVSYPILIVWLASIVLLSILRFIILHRYRHTAVMPSEALHWGRWFIIGAALSGILWGGAGIILFPSESVIHQVFLAFVLGGMAIGAIGAYSAVTAAFMVFSIPTLIPITIRFFLIGDEIHIAMGGMTLLFSFIVFNIGINVSAITRDSFRLRFELQASEKEYKESEERSHITLDTVMDAMILIDNEGKIIYWNPAAERIFKYTKEEIVGRDMHAIIVPQKFYEKFKNGFGQFRETGRGAVIGRIIECTALRKDGVEIPVELSVSAFRFKEKWFAVGMIRDITERKEAEENLRKSEEKLKVITSVLGEGIYVLDKNGCLTFLNPEAERLIGWSMEELLGREVHNTIHYKHADGTPFPAEDCPVFKTIREGKTYRVTHDVFTRRDGNMFPVSYVSTPIIEDGEVTGSVTAFHDITERLQTMEELRSKRGELEVLNRTLEQRVMEEVKKGREKDQMMLMQSRQASMGEMIGNIAHQWRQPLNTIGLLVQNLRDAYKFGEMNEGYLNENIKKGMEIIRHMSQTIEDFRSFFMPEKERHEFSLKNTIAKAISFVYANYKDKNIEIELDAKEDMVIKGYPNEYSQALLNILNNAKDALIENKIEKPLVRIRLFKEDGRSVVTISDNAGGIPDNIRDKIFDPYFTTKDRDKGTGIGLYMSKVIIEKNMGGSLTVRNVDGGAEFRIEV